MRTSTTPPPAAHLPPPSVVNQPSPVNTSGSSSKVADKNSRPSSPTEASQPNIRSHWSGKLLTDLQYQKLHEAVRGNDLETVKQNKNIDPCHSVAGHSALSIATELGHTEILNVLLSNHPEMNLNWTNEKGDTLLMLALRGEHSESAKLLLNQEAVQTNINTATVGGYTALHLAAMQGNKDIIRELVRLGADENAKTDQEATPLMLAKENGHVKAFTGAQKSGAAMARHAQQARDASNILSAKMEEAANFLPSDQPTIDRAQALFEKGDPQNLRTAIQWLKELPTHPKLPGDFERLIEYLTIKTKEENHSENALILFSKALSSNTDNRAEILLEFGNINMIGDTSENRQKRRKETVNRIQNMPNPPCTSEECRALINKLENQYIDSDGTLPDRQTCDAYALILERFANRPQTFYANLHAAARNLATQLEGERS
jgi:ankyrin repeat protein